MKGPFESEFPQNHDEQPESREGAINRLLALQENYVAGCIGSIHARTLMFLRDQKSLDLDTRILLQSIIRDAAEFSTQVQEILPMALGMTDAEFEEHLESRSQKRYSPKAE